MGGGGLNKFLRQKYNFQGAIFGFGFFSPCYIIYLIGVCLISFNFNGFHFLPFSCTSKSTTNLQISEKYTQMFLKPKEDNLFNNATCLLLPFSFCAAVKPF